MKLRDLTLAALFAAATLAAQTPDCSLVPGWTQKGPVRNFVSDNLFEYMDGNAEGYLIYRFVKMTGITCENGGDSIVFDVSEMADADAAYGIFASNRDPKAPVQKIGMAGQIVPRRAFFAKDKYYAEFAANPEKDHTPALTAFATAMEKRISGRTTLPEAIAWFPTEKLQEGTTIRLIPESVLGIRLLKRGYVAQYEYGKGFVVAEDTPQSAAEVMAKLKTRIGETQPAKIADEAFTATDRYLGRMCVVRKGRYITGYANLAESQNGEALSSALAAKIQ